MQILLIKRKTEQNKNIKFIKKKKSDLRLRAGSGRLEESSQEVQPSNYKINEH